MAEKNDGMTQSELAEIEATKPVPQSKHDYHYVVKHPFEQYQAGQWITDPEEVHKLLNGPYHHNCLRVVPR